MKKYPYFLPCAVPATFTLVAWTVTFLYLKETVRAPKPVAEFLGFKKPKVGSLTENGVNGNQDESYAAVAVSSKAKTAHSINDNANELPEEDKPLPLLSLLTPRVIVAAGNYASLSLVDITFRAIQPLFLSTPVELGGLGLPPSAIGNVLSVFGILNGVFQVFFFARINDSWGSKNLFCFGIASAIPLFASFPLINILARYQGYSTMIWVAVYAQIAISVALSLSYGKQPH